MIDWIVDEDEETYMQDEQRSDFQVMNLKKEQLEHVPSRALWFDHP